MANADAFPIFRQESRTGQRMEGSMWNEISIRTKYGCLVLQYLAADKPTFLEPLSEASMDWRNNSRVLEFRTDNAHSAELTVLLRFSTVEDFRTMRTALEDVDNTVGDSWVLDDLVHNSELFASGGHGSVYKARMNKNNQEVCIKQVSRISMTLESGFNEVRWMEELNHENIMKSYDTVYNQSDCFIFMPYLGARCLESILQDKFVKKTKAPKGLDEEFVKIVFRQILRGVQYLHDNNLIHDDLKPGNIFLKQIGNETSRDLEVKIGDLGTVEAVGPEGIDTKERGTLSYWSPERVAFKKHGKPSDIWSCGCILWEMMTGDYCFHAENDVDLRTLILKGKESGFLRYTWDKRDLCPFLIIRMLDPNPLERPTAAECLEHEFLKRDEGGPSGAAGPSEDR